jgi:methionyl-tRNA formyltransferase
MKNMSKTIVFFGSGPVAAASLDFLSDHFNIEAVITKSVPAHHKGVAPVEKLARKLKLPIIFASNKQELDNVIENHNFQSQIGIIVDYGVIVSQKIIDYFRLGIINSHFSLLPEWRGADPITFSILSGQSKTGVSLMLIRPTLDTGKLIARKSIQIDANDTTPILTKKLVELSNRLLLEYVPRYISSEIKPKEQPHPDRATYSRKLTKADGLIDWNKSAEQIEREIRAFRGWPGSRTTVSDKIIIITKAHVTNTQNSKLDIHCGDNKYLSIDELIAPSGRTMLAKDFINGYL